MLAFLKYYTDICFFKHYTTSLSGVYNFFDTYQGTAFSRNLKHIWHLSISMHGAIFHYCKLLLCMKLLKGWNIGVLHGGMKNDLAFSCHIWCINITKWATKIREVLVWSTFCDYCYHYQLYKTGNIFPYNTLGKTIKQWLDFSNIWYSCKMEDN